MLKAKEKIKEAHIIHNTNPADTIVWAEWDVEGMRNKDSEKKRKRGKREGTDDSRGKVSS